MRTRKPNPRSHRDRWIKLASFGFVFALLAVWMWPSSRVELDEQGYELTLALYRVCNQQDAMALSQVEDVLDDVETSSTLSVESRDAILAIISDAKLGRWKDAARNCRAALEDQVHY